MAGGDVRLAVEWDDNAVATYHLNFPDTLIYHGDIKKLTVNECCCKAGVKPGKLDILDGSPPCQGFSEAGKRNFHDDRNQLFREYVRLLQGIKPKVFVIENVSGMVKGKMRRIFVECLRLLKRSGYKVKARLLNTKFFNVPQSRSRLIFIGIRDDLGIEPSHPKARALPITVRQAIGHLPLGLPGNHSPQVRAAWYRAKPGQSLRKAFSTVGSFQSCRLDPCRPSPTQVKQHRNWHYAIPRQLNNAEIALVGGFPPDYQWSGSDNQIKQRIGNSVPPPLIQAIAEHVRDEILSRC